MDQHQPGTALPPLPQTFGAVLAAASSGDDGSAGVWIVVGATVAMVVALVAVAVVGRRRGRAGAGPGSTATAAAAAGTKPAASEPGGASTNDEEPAPPANGDLR